MKKFNDFLNESVTDNSPLLTPDEKKMITQMRETCKSDYYYDNPSAAMDDVEYLIKIVEKLIAEK